MDHLPSVSNQAACLPSVPYLEDSRFTYTAPFDDFGSRASVSSIATDGPDRIRSYSSFLQSCLSFGLLDAYFHEWQIPVTKDDFLSKDENGVFVTSKPLQEYLVAAVAYEVNEGQSPMADKDATSAVEHNGVYRIFAVKRARKRVANLHRVLQRHHKEFQQHVVVEDVHPAIYDSILILGATLSRAKDLIFRRLRKSEQAEYHFVNFSGFQLRSIPDLRFDSKWCPYERKLLTELIDSRLPEIAFFSQIERSRMEDSHLNCHDGACVAY